ncbi:hypothetical protein U1Q18_011769 [Sarracenia purpurea var. burkii]
MACMAGLTTMSRGGALDNGSSDKITNRKIVGSEEASVTERDDSRKQRLTTTGAEHEDAAFLYRRLSLEFSGFWGGSDGDYIVSGGAIDEDRGVRGDGSAERLVNCNHKRWHRR